jgi:hypothetical protein
MSRIRNNKVEKTALAGHVYINPGILLSRKLELLGFCSAAN